MQTLSRLKQFLWLLFLWVLVMSVGLLGGFLEYVQSLGATETAPVAITEEVPATILPKFVLNTAPSTFSARLAGPESISANSVWIYERETDSLLYENNSATATSVASLAKLMTALVAYDSLALDEPVTIGTAAEAIGNRAKFLPQDMFSVYDLLQALLIFSANDAAEALAQATDNPERFVEAMNQRATTLGLTNTNFINPSGLDHPDQYSSAADLGIIADHFLERPALAEIVRRPTVTLRELSTGRLVTVYSTNELLYRDARYQGLKTGTTELAGESLIVRYKDPEYALGPIDLIIVILGSQDRFADAATLKNWVEQSLLLPTIEPMQ